MSFPRQFYDLMMLGSSSYAKWDIETSLRILRDRRRMLILGLLLLPIALIGIALADEAGSALPGILGGKQAYGPADPSVAGWVAGRADRWSKWNRFVLAARRWSRVVRPGT